MYTYCTKETETFIILTRSYVYRVLSAASENPGKYMEKQSMNGSKSLDENEQKYKAKM